MDPPGVSAVSHTHTRTSPPSLQAANKWGHSVDKLPYAGRVRWVEDHLGTVLANATDPFGSRLAGPGAEGGAGEGGSLAEAVRRQAAADPQLPHW